MKLLITLFPYSKVLFREILYFHKQCCKHFQAIISNKKGITKSVSYLISSLKGLSKIRACYFVPYPDAYSGQWPLSLLFWLVVGCCFAPTWLRMLCRCHRRANAATPTPPPPLPCRNATVLGVIVIVRDTNTTAF